MFFLIIQATAVTAATGADPPIPSAILRCIEQRRAIEKADVQWSGRTSVSQFAPGVDFGRRSLLAGDDLIEFNLGNARGVTAYTTDGEPVSHRLRTLFNREMKVTYVDGDPFAQLLREYTLNPTYYDVRAFALGPQRQFGHRNLEAEFAAAFDHIPGERRFSQEVRDGLYEVTLDIGDLYEVKWWIDPERGWNVVRTEWTGATEDMGGRSEVELVRYGSTWYPARARYFSVTRDEPVATVTVVDARFNEPELPDELGIEHMGIQPGITFQRSDPETGMGLAPRWWTGEELVDRDEWRRLVAEGQVQPGPIRLAWEEKMRELRAGMRTPRARQAAARPASEVAEEDDPGQGDAARKPGGSARETPRQAQGNAAGADATETTKEPPPATIRTLLHPWEQYTLDFIERHKLDDAQTQRAWLTYGECRGQAEAYLKSRGAQIEAVRHKLEEARADEASTGQADAIAAAKKRLLELNEPVERIFEQQLKPRLERLLTRQQRQAAQAAAGGEP